MTYTHLLFDLDHTLLDFDRAEDLALNYLLEEAGAVSYTHLDVYKRQVQNQVRKINQMNLSINLRLLQSLKQLDKIIAMTIQVQYQIHLRIILVRKKKVRLQWKHLRLLLQ